MKENIKKSIKNKTKNIYKKKDSKNIVDMVDIKWYQFLCYFPLKQCSNNIKIILVENGRKFYKQNLDVTNVIQNIVMMKKLIDYMLTKKRIFGLSDNTTISYYDKSVISDNKFDYN